MAATVLRARKLQPRDVALRDPAKQTRARKPPPPPSRRRARTYQLRRQEIELRLEEVALLTTELDLLKRKARIVDPTSIAQQVLNNLQLRELLRNQQFFVAGLRSLIGQEPSEHVCSSVSSIIRLGADPETRREQMLTMKTEKLHDARVFLEQRTRFLNPLRPCSECAQFQTCDGDTYVTKFDSVPLPGATSVKQAFDTLTFCCFNLEFCTAELKGVIVVREEDDAGDESVAHNRLVYPKATGVPVETNNVVFAEYTPPCSAYSATRTTSDEGLLVADFVDHDEMYPYRPHERIREDVTSIFSVQAVNLTRPKACSSTAQTEVPGTASEHEPAVVVLTRWVQAKLHRSALPLSEDALRNARDEMNHTSDAIVAAVRGTFCPPSPSQGLVLAASDGADALPMESEVPLTNTVGFPSHGAQDGSAGAWLLAQDTESNMHMRIR